MVGRLTAGSRTCTVPRVGVETLGRPQVRDEMPQRGLSIPRLGRRRAQLQRALSFGTASSVGTKKNAVWPGSRDGAEELSELSTITDSVLLGFHWNSLLQCMLLKFDLFLSFFSPRGALLVMTIGVFFLARLLSSCLI